MRKQNKRWLPFYATVVLTTSIALLAFAAGCGSRKPVQVQHHDSSNQMKNGARQAQIVKASDMRRIRIVLRSVGDNLSLYSVAPVAFKYNIANCASGYALENQTEGIVDIPKVDLNSCSVVLASVSLGLNEYVLAGGLSHRSTIASTFKLVSTSSTLEIKSLYPGNLDTLIAFEFNEMDTGTSHTGGITQSISLGISGVESPYVELNNNSNWGYALNFSGKFLESIGRQDTPVQFMCDSQSAPAAIPSLQCAGGEDGCYFSTVWYAAPRCISSIDSHAMHKNAVKLAIIRQGDGVGQLPLSPTYAQVNEAFPKNSESFAQMTFNTAEQWPRANIINAAKIAVTGMQTTSNEITKAPNGLVFWLMTQYYDQKNTTAVGPSYKIFEITLTK